MGSIAVQLSPFGAAGFKPRLVSGRIAKYFRHRHGTSQLDPKATTRLRLELCHNVADQQASWPFWHRRAASAHAIAKPNFRLPAVETNCCSSIHQFRPKPLGFVDQQRNLFATPGSSASPASIGRWLWKSVAESNRKLVRCQRIFIVYAKQVGPPKRRKQIASGRPAAATKQANQQQDDAHAKRRPSQPH